MADDFISRLESWLALTRLSKQEIRERFAVTDGQIRPSSYEEIEGLTEFENPDTQPGSFFFRGDQFFLLYVTGLSPEVEDVSPQVLLEYLGQPAASLRSRAGKIHSLYVYPEKGLAFSAGLDRIDFLEIFPPTTLEVYQSQIYQDPGKFIR